MVAWPAFNPSKIPYPKYEDMVLDKLDLGGCSNNNDKKKLLRRRLLIIRSGWRHNHSIEEAYDNLLEWCTDDPFNYEDVEHWAWYDVQE